jgi:hypothetical protein
MKIELAAHYSLYRERAARSKIYHTKKMNGKIIF